MATTYTELLKEINRSIQIRFDKASENEVRIFDNNIFENYLTWDAPSLSLDFEELIGKYGVTIAAPTLGENAKEPVLGTNGLQTLKERVLYHAVSKQMSANEYRKMITLLDSKAITDQAKTMQLAQIIWGDAESVVKSVLSKLDLIFLRALSNCGICELNEENNPEGGVQTTINYGQPSGNKFGVTTTWEKGNEETADVVNEIQGVLAVAQDKVNIEKILISPSLLNFLCRTTKMKEAIWGKNDSSKLLTVAELNQYMQANKFPVFEVVRRTISIQTPTGVTPYTPWVAANMVFIPSSDLGVVKNAYANAELMPEDGVTYSTYNRILVSQFTNGDKGASNGLQVTKAEVNAIPLITEMNGIYTLQTNVQG